MKIKKMTAKTALEIQKTDVLIIEDADDTKQVSTEEFAKYLFSTQLGKDIIREIVENVLSSSAIEQLPPVD